MGGEVDVTIGHIYVCGGVGVGYRRGSDFNEKLLYQRKR